MGLIKAAAGALGGTLADQWKEFFYCDSLSKDVLVTRGQKQISGRSSNTKGHDNVISNGSGIAVADGQCMMIVEQGKIVEVCAEPGEFTYDTSSEPSIFAGNLGESVVEVFKTIGKRFTYGGDTAKDQRVYYFNTKEIMDNKFGTPNPFMFEFIDALQPAFASLSELELRPAQIPAHTKELKDAMNNTLKSDWAERRGITVQSIALNPITLTSEDMKKINQMEDAATMGRSPYMMAGRMVDSTATAKETAAGNPNGAMMGFMGMGMAQQAGAADFGVAQNFYNMGVQQDMAAQQAAAQQQAMQQQAAPASAAGGWICSCGATATGKFCPECGSPKPEPKPANAWKCSCGTMATGKFCPECGSPKPADDGWTCSCGQVNKGKFCSNCGAKKPAGVPLYKCDKCGWEPEDPANPPKFCPECGDPFNDNDIQ